MPEVHDLGDDIIWGVGGPKGIAAFLKVKPSRVYYLISLDAIPVKKVSHRIITASRQELNAWLRGGKGGGRGGGRGG